MFPNYMYLSHHADSYLEANGRQGLLRVIHVDDDYNYGLVYFCVDLVGDDQCLPGSGRLSFISRTDSIPNSKIKEIERAVEMPCLRDDQIDWNSHGREQAVQLRVSVQGVDVIFVDDCIHSEVDQRCQSPSFHLKYGP